MALLVDIGVDESFPNTLECESRPLIDLSNAPEVNQIAPLKPSFSGQVKVSYTLVLWCQYAGRKVSPGCTELSAEQLL